MKKLAILTSLVFVLTLQPAFGQVSSIVRSEISAEEANRIIRAFTANESAFREALTNYAFNRSATIQTIGLGGQITGTYRRDSFMTFTQDGRRFERIVHAPVSTLVEISVTPEDLEDLGGINPFALEPRAIDQYNFRFVGTEKIDELNLYVFDVTPKAIPDPRRTNQRLFTGRVWVDDRDLLIVKSKGKAVPETKRNKFPVVETWRENVDGKFWFPAFSAADDELVFDNGQVVKLRMRVRYTDYRLGRTDVIAVGDDEDVIDHSGKPQPSPTPKKP
jgi:hypothetical protein